MATVSNGTATYTYDAAGSKLRKVSVINGVTTTTEYISGIQYKNSTTAVDFIQTEEGKAVPNGTSYDYNYYLGDNLGNTRVTFGIKTGTAVLYQQDDYYPFGMEIGRSVNSPKNEYLYNKKELQEEFAEYDYSARFYDPVIGKWNTIDPLAELSRRWSPYNYVENNPIRLIDPDGMMSTIPGQDNNGVEESDTEKEAEKRAQEQANITVKADESGNSTDNGSSDQCCVTAQDHTAGKSTPKNPKNVSHLTYEQRQRIDRITKEVNDKLNSELHPSKVKFAPDPGRIDALFPENALIQAGIIVATDGASAEAEEFFAGATYTSKVVRQIENTKDLYHGFPTSVDGFAGTFGKVSTKIGGDGTAYQILELPGSYAGKTGTFEYIKDASGKINHRYFNVQ
ncbi:MAG: hypothetical protein JWR02_3022 [Mucilaginibacter sp.]|nr:hypothetical protein [Mucilaginibacter sp.]